MLVPPTAVFFFVLLAYGVLVKKGFIFAIHMAKDNNAIRFSLHAGTLYIVCLLTMLLSANTCSAQQVGGNLYDRYKNYGEEYIMQQQSQTDRKSVV